MKRFNFLVFFLIMPLFLTGFTLDNAIVPYEGYYKAMGIMFPVGDVRRDLPAKEMVLGIEIDGTAKAYPLSMFAQKADVFNDEIGSSSIQIILSEEGQIVDVFDHQSRSIPVIFAYWFAWQAFHPHTAVYLETQ